MKDTIRNTVKEVYNTNVKNIGSNSHTGSISASISDSDIFNTKKNVTNYQSNTNNLNNGLNSQMKETNRSSSNHFTMIIVFFLIMVAVVTAFYYYRKDIKKFLKKKFGKDKIKSKEVVKLKENDEELKETKSVSKKKDKIIEKDKMTIKKAGDIILEEKVVKKRKEEKPAVKQNGIDKSKYSKNQIVSKDDMYCYIGEDDNMRQCIQVFKDDVCTSGDIFNRIDECLVPRKNN